MLVKIFAWFLPLKSYGNFNLYLKEIFCKVDFCKNLEHSSSVSIKIVLRLYLCIFFKN